MSYNNYKRNRHDENSFNQYLAYKKRKQIVPPSKVIHLREVSDHAIEKDIKQVFDGYGNVSYISMMPVAHQALIEFETLLSAMFLFESTPSRDIMICGKMARFNYSNSEKINRNEFQAASQRVLLFNVIDPQFPITVQVMHTICSEHGDINRIVVFKKNGIQALVEFANAEGASKAKRELNGADIYSNCCTLKIEYAKSDRLNVAKNTEDSWDYTHDNPRHESSGHRDASSRGGADRGDHSSHSRYPDDQSYHNNSNTYYDNRKKDYEGRRSGNSLSGYHKASRGRGDGRGEVYMIYQLNGFNCNKLFNLLCLYGNVYKIKMLKSKEGSAMVQMELDDRLFLINGIECNGTKINMKLSTQQDFKPVANPISMEDGSPSYVDFTNDKNNRFLNRTAASKNRLEMTSKTLYYFSGSPEMTDEMMTKISDEVGAKRFFKFTKFPCRAESLATGLIEYESAEEATSALILINNYTIPNPDSKYPYILKFCFSQKRITIPRYFE